MNLQPLRIEAGWQVEYNQLYEVDATAGNEHYFEGSSLLMLKNSGRLKLIDVEWRPERDLKGAYFVRVLNYVENFNHKTNEMSSSPDWKKPHFAFSTQSRQTLVQQLEELMRLLPKYEDPRIVIKRGVVDEIGEQYRLQFLQHGFSEQLINNIINNGSAAIQQYILNQKSIPKAVLILFSKDGITKKIRNQAFRKLNSKQFRT